MKKSRKLLLLLIVGWCCIANCYAQSMDKNYIDSITRVFMDSTKRIQLGLIGQPFPEFEVKGIDKSLFFKDSLLGKTTFIAYWFYSCSPCRAAFDTYRSLARKADSSSNFQFISFTNDSESSTIKTADNEGLKFPIFTYFENYKTYPAFNFGYPLYIIVDKFGIIRFIKTGGYVEKEKSEIFFKEEILPKLEKILNEN